MGEPFFCVITPTFEGREILLMRAIVSVKCQTNQDVHHLVCGDGPCPEAKNLCREYGVQYIELPERTGAWGAAPRNLAVSEAAAEYLLFLDDDNYLLEDCIEILAANAKNKILIYKSLYYARFLKRHVILPPTPQVEKTKIDMGNFCVRSEVAKAVKFMPDYNQDFLYITEACNVAGWDIRWVNKILMAYLFAPAGKSHEIVANPSIW